MGIPTRRLGSTGIDVTILGLGGEGILRTFGNESEANLLINRALDLGINYFESARAYSGSESYYGSALKGRRKEIFLTSKSHARDEKGALDHLHETLRNMQTDYLDLWQVHDVRTEADIKEIFGPKGAVEAFRKAKEQGLVRFVGVTGHHNPSITRRCMDLHAFDTVLVPVNPAEPAHNSFLKGVVPFARRKGMGIIGMKVYLRGVAMGIPGLESGEALFRFALSQPIHTAVIGCDTTHQLEENVRHALAFHPLSETEVGELLERVSPFARRLMYYKP